MHLNIICPFCDRKHPVPFDFDMTGLVDVPYAVVNPKFRIKSPEERYYRGFKTTDEILQQTVKRFIDNKQAIIDLWSGNEFLPANEKEVALKYISDFYEVIEDPERLQKEIISKMRSQEKLESSLLKQYGE